MNLVACFSPADLAWAASAVEQAQQRFPRVCPNGLDSYYHDRAEHWSEQDLAMVCLCRLYFLAAEPIKTPAKGSYGLKHRIEQHFTINGAQSYVHNGSCIVCGPCLRLSHQDPLEKSALLRHRHQQAQHPSFARIHA
jgi:hypothetical protein